LAGAVRPHDPVEVEPMEPRVLLSFTPYVSGGWTATPNYEFLDRATGVAGTAAPLGSTSPLGAPIIPATMRDAYGLGTYTAVANSSSVTGYNYTYGDGITFDGIKGDGTGQTIAIVDVGSDPDIATDLQTFDAAWDLPNPPSFEQLSQTGSGTNLPAVAQGWPGEISLDVEWSHVMAPGANIILFAASDLYAAVQEAASYPGVSVVSMSFTVSGNAPDGDFVTPSGHTGVSFFAGNGDTGAEVPSPAQSTNVVAVGGTALTVNSSGTYNSESTWSAGGGGTSGSESQPAYQGGIVSAYSTTQRTTPDVSMDADPGTGVAIVDSYDSGSAAPWELIIGGTSLATPLTAGTVAVADQARVAEGLTAMDGGTQLLPRFYELYQANYAANFNDITTGNNGHPATVGYDEATGLGSLKANNLVLDIAGGDTVSGQAFIDNNGNGVYTAGTDTPLAGKAVYLDLNNSGVQTAEDPTTTTNATGGYTFTDVIGSATATVRLVGASGYLQENNGTFTTAYNSSQTYNLAFASTTTYAATATPATTTLNASLGVTITGTAGSGLTYAWSAGSKPQNAPAPTFTPNGTAAAQNSTVKFGQAGTYVLVAKVTNSSGEIATTSVTVTVTQVLAGLAVSPVVPGVGGGQTTQLAVTGYDQFGNAMPAAPNVAWSVVSGGASVTPAGVLTAPAAGGIVTVKASTGAVSATGTVDTVALPWTPADIGTLGNDGSALDSGGNTTLVEASDDIWGTGDDFLFDYQKLDTAGVTITAELVSQSSASGYVKAGVMIRNSLASDDVMAMENDPSGTGNGPLFEWRTSNTSSAAQDATTGGGTTPCWLRLNLSGGTVYGYSSPNGTTWTLTGSEPLAFGTDICVGLGLSSHNASDLATAVFSNVSVISNQTLTRVALVSPTPLNLTTGQSQQLVAAGYDQNGFLMSNQPSFSYVLNSGTGTLTSTGDYTATAGTQATYTATAGGLSASGQIDVVNSPWTSTDIGTVNALGTAYDTGTGTATVTTLTDESDDIWNESDDFHFDCQTVTGNATITAKINSQTTGDFTKAGLMIRNSLNPDDAMVMVFDAPGGSPFEYRTAAGTAATQVATSTNYGTPYYFKLTRNGSSFTGYSSPNGTAWTQLGTMTLSMNATVYVGLALTSHNTGISATAVFSNVSVSNPTIATAAAAAPSPATGTTTALSVLGADTSSNTGESSLTYTWAATNIPSGATAPAFSINGTNAAKNTTVTFHAAGTYVFTVTAADSPGDTVTSSVTEVVNQTVSSIVVSPATASLNESSSQTFAATGYDQFGAVLASQPAFTWSVKTGVGSINAGTGVYSSGTTAGSATVQASSGSAAGTASVTVLSTAPTITTAPTATPSPVTGTYASLSVAGTDASGGTDLTYTWAVTSLPAGAVTPHFADNGDNTAQNTTVTFYQAGSYRLSVTLGNTAGQTAAGSVTVTVAQTLGGLLVSPESVSLNENGTESFAVTATDQFGYPVNPPPTVTWSLVSGVGSVNASTGVYTAGAATGHARVQASSGSFTSTASVAVTNAAPTVATPASANPSTDTGTTTALSVLGADDGGESNLGYTWAATTTPAGAAVPTFSVNSTNGAKNTTATFYAAGSYSFTVTITDAGGLTATGSVAVTVNQTLTAVTVASATIAAGATDQATAVDQFGSPLLSPVNWSDTGGGTISTAGLFTANQSGGTFAISGSSGASAKGTAVTVVPTVYTGAAGGDTYAIRVSPANPALEQIFVNTTESAAPTYTIALNQLPGLAFDPAGGDGSLTIDFTNGNPLPAGGVGYVGGADPVTGGNALVIDGASAGGLGLSVNTGTVTDAAATASPVTFSNLQSVALYLSGGNNTLTQLAQPSAPLALTAGPGNNTLDVDGGSFAFAADPQTNDGNLTINDNTAVTFTASAAGSGVTPRHLAALNLGPAATASVAGPDVPADRIVLVLGRISLNSTSSLDLTGNDMVVQGGSLSTINTAIGTAYANGNWTGPGITSSTAAGNTTHLTALGAIQNTAAQTFDGQPGTTADVLVKYTYIGDANLDGVVDGSDYSLIDNGYASAVPLTGWANGDFNYDTTVDGSDYALIDNAFNNQAASLSPTAKVATPTAQIAAAAAISTPPTPIVIADPSPVKPAHRLPGTVSSAVAAVTAKMPALRTTIASAAATTGTARPAAAAAPAVPPPTAALPFYLGTKKVRHAPAMFDTDIVTSPVRQRDR
jgi:regulation of enolase protein 1 (concanavalin A-like superfamily)